MTNFCSDEVEFCSYETFFVAVINFEFLYLNIAGYWYLLIVRLAMLAVN